MQGISQRSEQGGNQEGIGRLNAGAPSGHKHPRTREIIAGIALFIIAILGHMRTLREKGHVL